MFSYFFAYILAAIPAISTANRQKVGSSAAVWSVVWVLLTIFVGWRHYVGGDWYNYLRRFQQVADLSLGATLEKSDPGYQLFVYVAHQWGLDIYSVNFFSAVLFVSGLVVFLRKEMNPWLGLTVALPYLIVVVSMGYTRQAVALGLVMWGLASLERKRFIRFLLFIALATSFHKSAVLMIAFGMFTQGRGKLFKAVAVVVAGVGIWLSFVEEESATLWKNYVEEEMKSQGAMIRVVLNFIPAVLLLLFRKKWQIYFKDYTLWSMVALASVASVVAVQFASTAVDRMALYFIPIQMVVYARLPFLARGLLSAKITTIVIVVFYLLILFVWLNYAANAKYWIPYQNLLFLDIV